MIAFSVFWLINFAYERLRNRTGIGLADMILFAAAAIWLPWQHYANFVLIACIGAFAFVLVQYMRRRESIDGADRIPFGAFLGFSIWLTVLIANG